MKRYKENYELKNSAKDTLDGKYGGAVLIIFLSALISQTARFFISSIAVTTMNTVYYSTGSESVSTAISFVFDLILLAANVVLGYIVFSEDCLRTAVCSPRFILWFPDGFFQNSYHRRRYGSVPDHLPMALPVPCPAISVHTG